MADSWVVPTSLGVNSSLTTSALAFRIAENIVDSSSLLTVESIMIAQTAFTSGNSLDLLHNITDQGIESGSNEVIKRKLVV